MDCVAPLLRGRGRRNPSVTSRCGSPLLLLTCALLMTSSHSEGSATVLPDAAGTPVLSVSVACGKWVFFAIPEDKANDPLMINWKKNGTMPISGAEFSGPIFNAPAYSTGGKHPTQPPPNPLPSLYLPRSCTPCKFKVAACHHHQRSVLC